MIELLPDHAVVRAQIDDTYDTYRADGADQAIPTFVAYTGLGAQPASRRAHRGGSLRQSRQPRTRATTGHFLAHPLRPATRYQPYIEALRAAPARIVLAAGPPQSQLASRAAMALASQPGTVVAEFPDDHAGFTALPDQFGRVLNQVLSEAT